MTLCEKLTQARKAAGLTQADVAARLDVSRQAVSRWESGQSKPSTEKLLELARIYDVSLDWLCSDSSDAGELVQEKKLDERDPMCNNELPAEDKPKKLKKWVIIIVHCGNYSGHASFCICCIEQKSRIIFEPGKTNRRFGRRECK